MSREKENRVASIQDFASALSMPTADKPRPPAPPAEAGQGPGVLYPRSSLNNSEEPGPGGAAAPSAAAGKAPVKGAPERAGERAGDAARAEPESGAKPPPLPPIPAIQRLRQASAGQRTVECFRADLIAQTRPPNAPSNAVPEPIQDDVPTRRIVAGVRGPAPAAAASGPERAPGFAAGHQALVERLLALLCICLAALCIALSILYTMKPRVSVGAMPSAAPPVGAPVVSPGGAALVHPAAARSELPDPNGGAARAGGGAVPAEAGEGSGSAAQDGNDGQSQSPTDRSGKAAAGAPGEAPQGR
jgi:hypothetical protein